jgi:hypothetical protein
MPLRVCQSARGVTSAEVPARQNPFTRGQPPFAGKNPVYAESWKNGLRPALDTFNMNHMLHAETPRGDDMTAPETRTYSINNILGAALLLFGAMLCYLHITAAMHQLAGFFPSDAVGLLPAIGLAVARMLENVTLDFTFGPSALLRFLLSCWPVFFLFFGVILLRKSLFPTLTPQTSANRNPASLSQSARGTCE